MFKFKGKVIVVGATGNVGRSLVEMLVESGSFDNIILTGSRRSAGSSLSVKDKIFTVQNTQEIMFERHDLCIFNTEANVSSHYVPIALAAGAYVVDSSSHFRMDDGVPLIVPPVNLSLIDIKKHQLFSHANCIVSPIATVIAPLHKQFKVTRVIASTYQSASGAGKKAMDECFEQTKEFCETRVTKPSECFQRPISFNIIPQVGSFEHTNFSGEEIKIEKEIKKVIDERIFISATSVRVPVLVGHSISLSIRLAEKCSLEDLIDTLEIAEAVKISDSNYSSPIEVVGKDNVFVGRIRSDESENEKWFHLWLCSDNLRIGAATDAFKVAMEIARQISL